MSTRQSEQKSGKNLSFVIHLEPNVTMPSCNVMIPKLRPSCIANMPRLMTRRKKNWPPTVLLKASSFGYNAMQNDQSQLWRSSITASIRSLSRRFSVPKETGWCHSYWASSQTRWRRNNRSIGNAKRRKTAWKFLDIKARKRAVGFFVLQANTMQKKKNRTELVIWFPRNGSTLKISSFFCKNQ